MSKFTIVEGIRTIVVPATGRGPMWHRVIGIGYRGVIAAWDYETYRQIVKPDHMVAADDAGTGWYQEGETLTWDDAVAKLREAAWIGEDDSVEAAEGILIELGYKKA